MAEEPEEVLPVIGSPPRSGSKKAVPRFWSTRMPPARSVTESMKRIDAITIIHTTIGMSHIFIPGARLFMQVTMKLMPPRRNATNSRKTAVIQSVDPRPVVFRLRGERRVGRPGATECAAFDEEGPEDHDRRDQEDLVGEAVILGKTMSSAPISGIR